MKFHELKKGDKILVQCPKDTGEWVEETITDVIVGEDGYKGSKAWFCWLHTNRSVNPCPDEKAKEGVHWNLLFPRLTDAQETTVQASPNIYLKVKMLCQ